MMSTLEFPKEIVNIIREYSKPCLLYPQPYKDVLKTFGLKRWPELMKKLSGNEASTFLVNVEIFIARMREYRFGATAHLGWSEDWDIRKTLLIAVYGELPDFKWWWNYDEDEE